MYPDFISIISQTVLAIGKIGRDLYIDLLLSVRRCICSVRILWI